MMDGLITISVWRRGQNGLPRKLMAQNTYASRGEVPRYTVSVDGLFTPGGLVTPWPGGSLDIEITFEPTTTK